MEERKRPGEGALDEGGGSGAAVSGKRVRQEKSAASADPFASAPEGLLEMISAAQKEALWKQLQETRAQCSGLQRAAQAASGELRSAREELARSTNMWSKLLSLLGEPEEMQIGLDVNTLITMSVERLGSAAAQEELADRLKRLQAVGELEATIQVLEEDRDKERRLLAERDEALLLCERKNRRLELEAAKKAAVATASSSEPGSQKNPQEGVSGSGEAAQPQQAEKSVLAELDALKNLAAQRLAELERVEKERADVRYDNVKLQEQVRKIPEDAFRDPRSLKDLREEIQHLRQELGRQRKSLQYLEDDLRESSAKTQRVLNDLEEALKGKLLDTKKFLDTVEADASRIRKERDQMRGLYEQVNAQVSAANRQNGSLQQLLAGSAERTKAAASQEDRNGRIIEILQAAVGASSEDQLAKLAQTIKQLKEDEQALYGELEMIGKAFEELQQQNAALIKQLADREESNGKLLGEKLKAEFALVQAKKDAELSLQKAMSLERASLERIEATETREREARRQLVDTEGRIMQKAIETERLQARLADFQEENSSLRARLDRLASVNYEQTIADKTRAHEAVQFEKRRLSEEVELLQKKLRGYMESGKGPQKDLEDELAIYKKLMKCNSCHIRDKDTVITKCMHVFCRQCLDTRIETRQRKCPNCGEAFGASDVRSIYL